MGRHEELFKVLRTSPSDFEPWGERSDDERGADCSCGCRWFHLLEDTPPRDPMTGRFQSAEATSLDWGVCFNPRSPRAGLLTFEHQGCLEFED